MYKLTNLPIFLFMELSIAWCLCPELKPTPNVITLCNIGNQRQFNCKSNKLGLPTGTGTTVEYKCIKHFKSVDRGHISGRINCTNDGWTNERAFHNFLCQFDCGKQPLHKNELISGGKSTKPKNWPWVATIFRLAKDNQFKYVCGGTLIGHKTVLTAAHCVVDDQMNNLSTSIFHILIGTISSSFEENVRSKKVQVHIMKEIHVNPDYSFKTLQGDVAVIELAEPVVLDNFVHPVCLPRSYEHDTFVTGMGNYGEISSFGIDETGYTAKILQHARIPIASSANCNDVIDIIPLGDQFCAGVLNGPKICRGDSGSGLVFKSTEWNEEKYFIHGIVSNTGEVTNGCAPLTIFTKVFSYINWIQEKLVAIENLDFTRKSIHYNGIVVNKKSNNNSVSNLYTPTERKALKRLRPMVENILLEDYMHKDEYLIRYLRTKRLNLKETKVILNSTMEWRKSRNLKGILKEDFTDLRNDYPAFGESFDKDGRPVLLYLAQLWDFGKLFQSSSSKIERFREYGVRNIEKTEEIIRAVGRPNITQVVIINDFDGLKISWHLCAVCLRNTAEYFNILQNYYPQQWYMWYMINTPIIAERFFQALPLPSIHLLSRIRVFGKNKTEWSQELLKQIPANQLYVAYGGTKVLKKGTKRIQLAL